MPGGPRETVVYHGVAFHRYPESPHSAQSWYFSGRWHGKKTHLHRVIYLEEVGPIPDGFEVHHRDEDPLNNAVSNLELLTGTEHRKRHHAERLRSYVCRKCGVEFQSRAAQGAVYCSQKCRNAIRTVHGKVRTLMCIRCGLDFTTTQTCQRFCSRECAKGAYWEENRRRPVTCAVCSKPFLSNKAKQVCCSVSCGLTHSWRRRKAASV